MQGSHCLDGRASATHHVRAPLPSALPLASLVNAPLTLDHTFHLVPRNPLKGMLHPMVVTRSGLCIWMPSLVSMGQPGLWLPIWVQVTLSLHHLPIPIHLSGDGLHILAFPVGLGISVHRMTPCPLLTHWVLIMELPTNSWIPGGRSSSWWAHSRTVLSHWVLREPTNSSGGLRWPLAAVGHLGS